MCPPRNGAVLGSVAGAGRGRAGFVARTARDPFEGPPSRLIADLNSQQDTLTQAGKEHAGCYATSPSLSFNMRLGDIDPG
jgi:hypothetical protein